MSDLAFLWHMHQPDYRHPKTGAFVLPWVLLHGIKDYADMAGHLERHPRIRCTVNFVPVLLDQIEDYVEQFASGTWRDPLLAIVASDDPDRLSEHQRHWLLDMAFRCHAPTMLEPFGHFRRLRDLHKVALASGEADSKYLSGQYFADLATWQLLAWSGETLRREGGIIAELLAQGEHFSVADRQHLLARLGQVMAGLIPRYRALAERGQIELSCTPSHHPLAPLLLDFASAREAWPECPLPANPAYPGGRARVGVHIASAQESHTRRFGQKAVGLWPAEGAISTPFLAQTAEAGFVWAASSQSVLRHSAGKEASPYQPWRLPENPLTLFFRDERLSDLIGFEYARWHGADAAAHFIGEVQAATASHAEALVPVFLDGENAWEYYPYNAWYFFDDLYLALAAHPEIRTVTLSEAAARHAHRRQTLPHLKAGSWVYGSFSTWIGSPDKNHAWELLCEAKQSADRSLASGQLSATQTAAVLERLAICESSDWFWWFGDNNPAESVACFDRLFRDNIKALYRLLQLPTPMSLDSPVSLGGGRAENAGTMRRSAMFPD